MSKQSVNQVIQRAVSDAAFRRQLQRDPASALAGFDLTREERAAITSGDPARLTTLGVDQRMSKAFSLGAVAGSASQAVIGDAGASFNPVLVDETTSTGHGALIDDAAAGSSQAIISPDVAGSASGALIDDGGASFDAGLISPDVASPDAVIVGDPTAASAGSASLMSADGTAFDAGSVRLGDVTDVGDGSATAFEPAGSGGGDASLDAGAPTGGYEVTDAGDLSTDASTLDESGGVQDTGGDVHPSEY